MSIFGLSSKPRTASTNSNDDPLPPLSFAELENWIIEKGDAVIQRRSIYPEMVNSEEELVYCLWCVDYGMRNAGDLTPALDIKSDVLPEAFRLATELGLPRSQAFFAQSAPEIEQGYFDQFEPICSEVEAAYQAMLERPS